MPYLDSTYSSPMYVIYGSLSTTLGLKAALHYGFRAPDGGQQLLAGTLKAMLYTRSVGAACGRICVHTDPELAAALASPVAG